MSLPLRRAAGRPGCCSSGFEGGREGAHCALYPEYREEYPEHREDAQELPLKQGLRNGAPVESMKRRPGYLLLSICIGHLKHISI